MGLLLAILVPILHFLVAANTVGLDALCNLTRDSGTAHERATGAA
jgi:hypothetical protein